MQLVVNVPEVPADGPVADPHVMGNFLVGKTLGQQSENLVLARRESFHIRRRRRWLLKESMTLRAMSRDMGAPPCRTSRTADMSSSGVHRFSR